MFSHGALRTFFPRVVHDTESSVLQLNVKVHIVFSCCDGDEKPPYVYISVYLSLLLRSTEHVLYLCIRAYACAIHLVVCVRSSMYNIVVANNDVKTFYFANTITCNHYHYLRPNQQQQQLHPPIHSKCLQREWCELQTYIGREYRKAFVRVWNFPGVARDVDRFSLGKTGVFNSKIRSSIPWCC